MFNGVAQHSTVAGLSALPVAVFEFSLGVWLIVKGFDPRAVAELDGEAIAEDIRSGSATTQRS